MGEALHWNTSRHPPERTQSTDPARWGQGSVWKMSSAPLSRLERGPLRSRERAIFCRRTDAVQEDVTRRPEGPSLRPHLPPPGSVSRGKKGQARPSESVERVRESKVEGEVLAREPNARCDGDPVVLVRDISDGDRRVDFEKCRDVLRRAEDHPGPIADEDGRPQEQDLAAERN